MSFRLSVIFMLSVSIVAQAWPSLHCGQRDILGMVGVLFDTPIVPKQFPYLADIMINRENMSKTIHCSGALITQEKVLTSLKCFGKGLNNETDVLVRPFGAHKNYKVQEVTYGLNPNLNDKTSCENATIENGLAIVKLTHPVPLSVSTNRACLDPDYFEGKDTFFVDKYFTTGYKTATRGLKYAFPLLFAPCPPETPDAYVCGANKRDSKASTLLEGTPLVKNSKGRWYVVGITMNDGRLWGNCSSKADKGYHRFLKLSGDDERKFIGEVIKL